MKKLVFLASILLLSWGQIAKAQQWSPITRNNIWNLNLGNVGIGTTNPISKLDILGEIRSTLTWKSNIRMVGGNIAAMFRNDGKDTHLLFTNQNDINGTWNNLRPLRIDNITGDVFLGNSNVSIIHKTGNVGIGINNPMYKLDISGEICCSRIGVSNIRMVGGNIAAMFRNDGKDTHLLFTNQNDINGTWNNLRPLRIDNITGDVFLGNSNVSIIHKTGNVGIGYTEPTAKLDVNGLIRAREIRVCLDQGCDYVFGETYNLMSLGELKKFIETNKHLPEIAPAEEMENNGINLSEMNALLLKKIEELTLYIIQQQEQIDELKDKLNK